MYLVTSNKTEKDLVHDRDTMLLKTRLIQSDPKSSNIKFKGSHFYENTAIVSPIYQGYEYRIDRRDQKMGDGFKYFCFLRIS